MKNKDQVIKNDPWEVTNLDVTGTAVQFRVPNIVLQSPEFYNGTEMTLYIYAGQGAGQARQFLRFMPGDPCRALMDYPLSFDVGVETKAVVLQDRRGRR